MRRGAGLLVALIVGVSPAVVASLGSASSGTMRAEPIAGYRVAYRVEDRSRVPARITTEVHGVRRPYDGRLEIRSDGGITSGQVTNRDYFWQLGEKGIAHFGVRRIPAGAARDMSYSALLDAAREGVVDALGIGRFVGRRCTWFAFAEPGPQVLEAATRESRVESCVDVSGILLSEVWTVGGRAVRIVQAVSVSERVPSDQRFLIGRDPSSATVERPDALRLIQGQFVVDDDAEVDLPTSIRPPRGWTLDRRALASTAGGGRATQFLSETFVKGHELVVVERGTHPELPPPWSPEESLDEAARLVHYVDRVELRLLGNANVGFVRVSAPASRIAGAFVRGLRPSTR